jgi:DHA3 family macrolide efflux protein-like MFS transporter
MQKDSFRAYLLFWFSQSVSQLGSAMTSYALVLWVFDQTQSALSVSLLTFFSYVPYVLASLFAGGLVDRCRKKSVMLCADSVAFLCSAAVVLLLAMGRLRVPAVYCVNAITGLMNAFQSPASAVAGGLLVPRDKLTRMSGLQSMAGSAIAVATPMLASSLMSFFGIGCVLAVDMISFLFAASVLLFAIRIPEPPKRGKPRGERPLSGAREGWAFLKGQPVVLTLILSMALLNFFSRISYENILSPMILSRSGSKNVLGLVSGILGVGGIVGGAIAAKLPAPRNIVRRIFGMAAVSFVFGDLLMGAGRAPLFWVLAAVGGSLPIPILDAGYQYVLYTQTPQQLQGRVFAARNALQYSTIPMGILLGGFLADRVFEPFMAGSSAAARALQAVVGAGAGSGMAVMFLMTGALGILSSLVGARCLRGAMRRRKGQEPT